jgi:hypothetical protein
MHRQLFCEEVDGQETLRPKDPTYNPRDGYIGRRAHAKSGMSIGDIVSKTKQANTHYTALISYPNGQE